MNRRRMHTRLLPALASTLLLAGIAPGLVAQQPAGSAEWAGVERTLGRAGQLQPDGAMKFGFPRSDLSVRVGEVQVKPALALGSWVAFRRSPSGFTMAMGDLVLTEDEVAPVLTALEAGGMDATAIHNHLLGESPRVLYVHIRGEGDPEAIASTVHGALARTKTPLEAPAAAAPAAPLELDTAAIAGALGRHGKVNGGVYQLSVARAERVREHGVEVPPSMGVSTAINFQPTGGGRAAVTGDFVLTTDEVIPVTRALRQHGIQPTALHSHMLGEEPRLYFMHFWAVDDALTLARGLRAALDLTKSKAP